jgi:hypothetical protein
MARFALRHWTAILIILLIGGWGIFYVPRTPAYAIFQLKQAIDARDGNGAARYVDFQKVVRNAGYEMVASEHSGEGDASNMLGELVGKGAVDLFSGPMAALLQQWGVRQVDDGAKEVQMPTAALAGAIVMLHRHDDSAYTQWTDRKGQVWEVRMALEDGGWKIVEVKNVKQLLDKLRHEQEKQFDNASPPP